MPHPSDQQTCRLCHHVKPLDEFYASKTHSSGRETRCKDCALAANKSWREANAERVAARKRRYHLNNAERLRAYTHQWQAENRDRYLEYARDYQRSLREADSEGRNAARRQERLAKGPAIRETERRWREANRDWYSEFERQAKLRRRARILGSTVGPVDPASLWTGFCGICGEQMDAVLAYPDHLSKSIDHIVPLAKGGAHTQDNIQWAHLICNIRKGVRDAPAS